MVVENSAYIGFANLPNQINKKYAKKGFEFTLMVVGESGLGKSTLINSLFLTDIYKEREIPTSVDMIPQTVEIKTETVKIEERGVKLKLTVVDTPGYGDSINNTNCFRSIIDYIDQKYEKYLQDESGITRRNIIDNRVHCCFYFINPSSHGLKPIDIEFMKHLHEKVNIMPIVAKADTLTIQETVTLKRQVIRDLDEAGIHTYSIPDADSDEDEEYKEEVRKLKDSMPFAVIGSNSVFDVNGQKVRGRQYPWGIVEVENPEHSDFTKLRSTLISHLQDLQETTHDILYEAYRTNRLSNVNSGPSLSHSPGVSDSDGDEDESQEKAIRDREREVKEKELELKRMQEQLAKYQRELEEAKRNSSGSNSSASLGTPAPPSTQPPPMPASRAAPPPTNYSNYSRPTTAASASYRSAAYNK